MSARVLCIVHDLESGPGTSILGWARNLRGRFEFAVCELSSMGEANKEAARAAGVRIVQLELRGSDPRVLGGVIRVVREFEPHLVQGCELDTNFYACLAAWRARVPFVASFHGMESPFRRSRAPFLHAALGTASRVACVSAPIAQRCSARAPWARPRLAVTPNGVDCGEYRVAARPRDRATCVVTYVGNFHSEVKGHAPLLQAAALFAPGEIELRLVGSGRLEESMRALAGELGLMNRVRFLGQRADVRDLLADSDVFVMPSSSEGCPHALLEAMACGVPVVATRVGGIPEIVEDGRSGLLVPPNDPVALRDGLRSVLADDDLRVALSAAARCRVEEAFDEASAAARMGEQYALALST